MITEAAVGSTLCKFLLAENRTTYCLLLFIASYLCAGIGMLLAAAIIVLYLQRLILHHLPPREVVVSSWLPVGPIGQGGFALIELGHVAVMLFPRIDGNKEMLQMLGPAMLGSAVLLGLLLWGCAHLPLRHRAAKPDSCCCCPTASVSGLPSSPSCRSLLNSASRRRERAQQSSTWGASSFRSSSLLDQY